MKLLRGTSIIEIVVATAMISVAVIAALSLTAHSQKQSSYARGLEEATRYTTQAADWLRTQRDTIGWTTIAAKPNGTYCLSSLPADFSGLPAAGNCGAAAVIPGTGYKRQIVFNSSPANLAAGVVKINISVTWEEKITRSATIEMELTSWH